VKVHQLNRFILMLFIVIASVGISGSAETIDVPDRTEARKLLDAAATAGDLDAMAEQAEAIALAELMDYFDAAYELLRIHCQRHDRAAAFETVEAMLDAGFWDYRRLLGDEELALINTGDELREMIRDAWAEGYIAMLERESRDEMQHPDKIMSSLAIQPGEVAADIGAGSGYFTVRAAAAVGGTGRVIATDIRQQMLDYIEARLLEGGIDNVELLKVGPEDPGLPGGEIDTVLMVDVMHYVKDRADYAKKLRPALASGGRVVVIDFRYDPEAEREFAPHPEQQVPREVLDREMAEAGFEVAKDFDFLPEQYFVIYRVAE
jgi:ubiquinone/menaquinone biosynthesis C-methylase UbiE